MVAGGKTAIRRGDDARNRRLYDAIDAWSFASGDGERHLDITPS
jgi:hypothetical protein